MENPRWYHDKVGTDESQGQRTSPKRMILGLQLQNHPKG
jgi:hypothetical protein